MKKTVCALAGAMLATTFYAAPAEAGPFDRLKKAAKKLDKAADDVAEAAETVDGVVDAADSVSKGKVPKRVRARRGGGYAAGTASSNYPRTAGRGNYLGRAPAAPAKYASMTNCASLNVGNAFIAQQGEYSFSTGLKTETRGGLVERESVSPSNGCVFPGLGVGDVLYVEVDRGAFNKHEYEVQCVSFDGSKEVNRSKAEIGPRANNFTGKDVMLHSGNSLGYTPTASGSNSDRSGAYNKYLAGRGREMITFNMPEQHNDKAGTDFYCQYYHAPSGKSAVAFTYRRGPVGRK